MRLILHLRDSFRSLNLSRPRRHSSRLRNLVVVAACWDPVDAAAIAAAWSRCFHWNPPTWQETIAAGNCSVAARPPYPPSRGPTWERTKWEQDAVAVPDKSSGAVVVVAAD